MVIYPIIPLLIIIGLLLLLKKANIQNIINGLFWSIIALLFTIIIDIIFLPILGISSNINLLLTSTGINLSTFIIYLLIASLPEETSKLISIKFSSKKEKNSIIINSILIGITYACIENIMYINNYGSNLVLTRMLQPGHLFFQIIMGLFLIKALNNSGLKKTIFNILALIIPMFCHTIFNTLNKIDIISYIFYAIGILTYIYTIYLIYKLPVNTEKKQIKLIWLKIIVIVLSTLFIIIIYSQNNSNTLNEIQKIKEDNIELKVISSEKIEIKNSYLNGNYIKIKVEIKNNNKISYNTDGAHFSIVDNLNKNKSYLSIRYFNDSLKKINAGETTTGYLYFNDEEKNYTYLIYTTGEFGNTQTYSFNLK